MRKTTQKKIHKVDGPAVSHVPIGSKVFFLETQWFLISDSPFSDYS